MRVFQRSMLKNLLTKSPIKNETIATPILIANISRKFLPKLWSLTTDTKNVKMNITKIAFVIVIESAAKGFFKRR